MDRVVALLVGLLLAGCSAPPDPRADLLTDDGAFRVTWRPAPDPIPTSSLFTVEATVRDAKTGAPVEDATVRVNAGMPAHGHGMQTRPEGDPGVCSGAPPVCRHPGGVYVTRGMNFHMPGEWTITVDVERGATTSHLDVKVAL